MSVFVFNGVGTPNTPATGKTCVYVDSSDGRLKSKDSTGTISILQANGFDDKNILVNGGFDINQRVADSNTAVSGASATARVYVADRWTITTSNVTTPQFQRVDTIAAIETGITARFYGKFTQITNGAKHLYAQAVPGDTLTQLRGRTVRFQLKAKSFAGSNRTMRLGLIQLNSAGTTDTLPATFVSAFNGASVDPTLGTNLAYITPSVVDNGTVVGSAMNFTLTGSWARYSATFTVPSNCVNLVVALWNDSTGAAADSIGITECGLYDGAEIRDWLPFPQESVLARAQHFYAKSFPQGNRSGAERRRERQRVRHHRQSRRDGARRPHPDPLPGDDAQDAGDADALLAVERRRAAVPYRRHLAGRADRRRDHSDVRPRLRGHGDWRR
jgi:hypothetical protein